MIFAVIETEFALHMNMLTEMVKQQMRKKLFAEKPDE